MDPEGINNLLVDARLNIIGKKNKKKISTLERSGLTLTNIEI